MNKEKMDDFFNNLNNKKNRIISNYNRSPIINNEQKEKKINNEQKKEKEINNINNEKAIYVYEYMDGYARRIKINDAPDEEW
jgi:hypothetical protein